MKTSIKRILMLGLATLLLLGFQNCSDFSLQDKILYEQYLFESREALDAKTLPSLLVAETLSLWSKPGNSQFVKKDPFFANQWSVIVAVDSKISGPIVTINSNANDEETSLSVVDGKIRAMHSSTVNDYSYMEVPVPTEGDRMVLAAAFGAKSTEISLMVNGVVQTAVLQSTGTPVDFSFLAKTLTVGGVAEQVFEYVVYGGHDQGVLTNAELNVMSRYVANNNAIPNIIFDPSILEGDSGPTPIAENPRFLAAKEIIDRKCLGCHSNANNGDFRNLTESKVVQMGLITAKDPQNSKLYYRLQNSTGGPLGDAKRDMPLGDSITPSEVQTISDWIANF